MIIKPPPEGTQLSSEKWNNRRNCAFAYYGIVPLAKRIAYKIAQSFFVNEYPPSDYYEISEYAELPVYVKTLRKRTGDIGYFYCVQQPFESARGGHF